MQRDVIGFVDENLGEPIMKQYIKKGRQIIDLPTIGQIQEHLNKELIKIPDKLKSITKQISYPRKISKKIRQVVRKIKKEYREETSDITDLEFFQ